MKKKNEESVSFTAPLSRAGLKREAKREAMKRVKKIGPGKMIADLVGEAVEESIAEAISVVLLDMMIEKGEI